MYTLIYFRQLVHDINSLVLDTEIISRFTTDLHNNGMFDVHCALFYN
jgi:hypothetical protein